MRRLIQRFAGSDRERGATAVLVALLLTVMVGFTGLAVDGSATMAKRQELQNGADAAALAAAQECGENGCAGIDAVAGPYGVANVRAETASVDTELDADESAREVTATVTGTKTHWFLPVLGIDSTELTTTATAAWGAPQKGPSMLPLAVSQCNFENAAGPVLGVQISVYMPKNGSQANGGVCNWGSDYPPGSFGWLDHAVECQVEIVVGAYVDTKTGTSTVSGCDFASLLGETVLIPIFDDDIGTGASGKVRVTRFAALELKGIKPSNGGSTFGQACGPKPSPTADYHNTCLTGIFKEYVASPDDYLVSDDDTEVTVVTLID